MTGRTIIYGTGSAARNYLDRSGTSLEEVIFASTEGGGAFCGRPVLGATEAARDPSARFVIASSFVGPIIETLRHLGVPADRIAWYNPSEERLIPAAELDGTVLHGEILYALYDIEVAPPDYDAAVFAALAEVERRRRGLKFLHFLVVPARLLHHDGAAGEHRPLLNGMFGLIETVRGVSFLASRIELVPFISSGAAVFGSEAVDAADPRVLAAPSRAHARLARRLAGRQHGRKIITLTLREVPDQPDRTPHWGAWRAFLASLPAEFMPVLVRDGDHAIPSPLSDLAAIESVAGVEFDLAMRLALYESAYLNLAVHGDAAKLLYLSPHARYLSFNGRAPARFDRDEDALDRTWPRAFGQALPFAGARQRLVGQSDELASIADEFWRMIAGIEGSGATGVAPVQQRDGKLVSLYAGASARLAAQADAVRSTAGERGRGLASHYADWAKRLGGVAAANSVGDFDPFPEDDGTMAFAERQKIFDARQDQPPTLDRPDLQWRHLFADGRCGIFFTFGQSNAANAGAEPYRARREVLSLDYLDMRAHAAADPLPGCGGRGGSIWSHLGDLLIERGLFDRVLFVPVALGGSSVRDWLPGGPCHRRTALALARLRKALGTPDLPFSGALWVQGESDAADPRISAERYRAWLQDIAVDLREQGLFAPLFVARATRGPGVANRIAIRTGQDAAVDEAAGIFAGPDLDRLAGTDRSDGCHFSGAGLRKAAGLWAECLQGAAWALERSG